MIADYADVLWKLLRINYFLREYYLYSGIFAAIELIIMIGIAQN